MNGVSSNPLVDPFRPRMQALAALFFAGGATLLVDYAVHGVADDLTNACVAAILALMALIVSSAGSARMFLFSCGFWVTVEFLFYIVFKTFDITDDIEAKPLQEALLASMLFLAGYYLGQLLWPMQPRLHPAPQAASKRLYYWLLLTFVGFKLINYGLLFAAGGDTALEVSQNTQNGGASYLFKIPTLASASYFLILLFAYKHKLYKRTAWVMTLVILAEGVAGAARYSIVTTILINLLLYHMYVRPLRLAYLLLVTPILVFVITFFGYVRDIELASVDVYLKALDVFLDQRELMFKLLMGRLDMLPQMAEAFRLDDVHQLKTEWGLSYVYSVLHAIPRSLWPDKPPLTAAYVTEVANPFVFEDGVNIYPSVMVEGYMNFAWAGTALIGVVLAGLSAIYDRALMRGSLRTQAFALMAFTFPMAFINEGFHSNIFGTLLYLMLIYWLWLRATRWVIGSHAAARLSQL